MKTRGATIFVKQGHAFQIELYLNCFGEPHVVQHEGRRDMPATCFHGVEGELWVKTSEIVAIHYEVMPTPPDSRTLGH